MIFAPTEMLSVIRHILALLSLAAIIVLSSFGPLPAETRSVAASIADGQPWSLTTADGRSITLTLNPDGTGLMEGGPMTMRPSWRATRTGLCINVAVMGEHCMTYRKVPGGFDSYENGVLRGRLRR
jgi:hypothetical protein